MHLVLLLLGAVAGQLSEKSYHTTKAASVNANNLTCVHCNTMLDPGAERCSDLLSHFNETDVPENLLRKCPDDMRTCMVKKFSYTTSTENTTSVPRMWSLERNCSSNCVPGCIIIGERTKLYACTACCDTSRCNMGMDAAYSMQASITSCLFPILLFLLAQ